MNAIKLFKGIAINSLMYFSTFYGSVIMMVPSLPLLFIYPKLYRKYNDFWGTLWFRYPVALYELSGTTIYATGDDFPANETAIILLNHRTYFDWLFFWSFLLRFGSLRHEKIVLKSILKKFIGPGWAMQVFCFLFVHRKWEDDKHHMEKLLKYFVDINYPIQLLIFPEGTDLDSKGKAASDRFATKAGLPLYDNVLHPRTTGFVHCVNLLRDKVEVIYDVTVAYPKTLPSQRTSLIKGYFPEEIHFDVQRYPLAEMPVSDEDLEIWLKNIWAKKEAKLKEFYANEPGKRKFKTKPKKVETKLVDKILAFVFWTGFVAAGFYFTYQSFYFRAYIFAGHLFFAAVTMYFGGLDNVEVNLRKSRHHQKKD